MRRALLPLALLCACAAPPLPSPTPPGPRAAERPSWLELSGTKKATVLTRHDPDGREGYKVPLAGVDVAFAAPDGGAYVVLAHRAGHETTHTLLRVAGTEGTTFRVPVSRLGERGLVAVGDRVFVRARQGIDVLDAASGRRLRGAELTGVVGDMDGNGDLVAVVSADGVTALTPEGARAWSTRLRLFPSMDPTAERTAERRVAVGADGTVLTGASDGSLVAFDRAGRPLYQLGVRGAVERLEARRDGDFVVRTAAGIAAVIGPGGAVRREVPREAEPTVDARVVDHRSDGAGARRAGVSWRATTAYRARRAGPEGAPFGAVRSVLALAPDDVWVLGSGERKPGRDEPPAHLFHHDGRTWTDLGVPAVRFAKEAFAEGHPPAVGTFVAQTLGRRPGGALLVIGARTEGSVSRMCVLERVGAELRERRELFAAVSGVEVFRDAQADLTYAASAGGREVLCRGQPNYGGAPPTVCVGFGRGGAPAILPDGEGQDLPDGADEAPGGRRLYLRPIAFAGETLWRANGWANGPADVGGFHEATITRWNGAAFERLESPSRSIHSAWASGREDVWITGAEGVARFDGAHWWRIPDLDEATSGELFVTGSGRGDVWIFGPGLFHVTPDPSALPDLEGAPAPPPPAAPPSRALRVSAADPAYTLERVTIEVDGDRPLRAALGVAEGPDGVRWFWDGARVIEHDGSHARVIHRAPAPAPFVCWSAPETDCAVCAACSESRPRVSNCRRCAAPTAAGEGAVLGEVGLQRVATGHAVGEPEPLSALIAVAASPTGALWSVSGRADDALPHAVVLGPGGLRHVTGLPPAAYADVAARADDDVWLAGGLTTAEDADRAWPEGEGVLVRFDGHAFTRRRGPDGALLAVTAATPGEAWAVGLGGGVLHVAGEDVEAFHLEAEDGARLRGTLRGVATGAGGVWMVGDGATLLRWDGRALQRVGAGALGRETTLTGVIAPSARPGWVVGPGGIWRLRARS